MKVVLQFMAFYPIELPDINPSAPVFDTVLGDKIRAALGDASDKWMMEYVGYMDADQFDEEAFE